MKEKAAAIIAQGKRRFLNIRWLLVFYDTCIFAITCLMLLKLYTGVVYLTNLQILVHFAIGSAVVFVSRLLWNVYRQIWRYGGIESYIKLLLSDGCAFFVYNFLQSALPEASLSAARVLAISCINLLGALAMRMIYRYAYKFGARNTFVGKLLLKAVRLFGGAAVLTDDVPEVRRIKVAIVGAGRLGVALAEELINNRASAFYTPRCFIDISKEKIGKQIYGIPVIAQDAVDVRMLQSMEIQEIIFALPHVTPERRMELYEFFKNYGCKIKVYDYPTVQNADGGRRSLREFDIEELLFRRQLSVVDEATAAYYHDKRVLITGGGGSIGSELCRQIAKMKPQRLVVLDVFENGAYDVQQELKTVYGDGLDLRVEIVSVCNRAGLERVFREHRPQVVLNAAAHKHVPLMEKNCVEAVENNVFGTLNTVELSEAYGVERVIMVSTDKAVNPTNVMGATKRMCEMIVQAYSKKRSGTTYSATRFGNVLGSAGSVVPLFKRQIARGGPITITDKRIIRYFMTIPEASQLVLQSGAMANNGELFVLDMGKPVKILELAESMIQLSGLTPYKDIDIVETGLRPGEKLYEELLVKTETLKTTANSLIFVEREDPITMEQVEQKLQLLRQAVATGDDETVRQALKQAVPTYRAPEEVNADAHRAQEMKQAHVTNP